MRSLLGLFALACAAPALAQAAPEPVLTPVLGRIVERGEILSEGDFAVEDRTAAQARGALQPAAAAGREAVRRLSAGAVVRASDVAVPRMVRRGEPVTIKVRSGGLTITASGRALADGRRGDTVRVVASSTNRTLDALVEGSGTVRVSAP